MFPACSLFLQHLSDVLCLALKVVYLSDLASFICFLLYGVLIYLLLMRSALLRFHLDEAIWHYASLLSASVSFTTAELWLGKKIILFLSDLLIISK